MKDLTTATVVYQIHDEYGFQDVTLGELHEDFKNYVLHNYKIINELKAYIKANKGTGLYNEQHLEKLIKKLR